MDNVSMEGGAVCVTVSWTVYPLKDLRLDERGANQNPSAEAQLLEKAPLAEWSQIQLSLQRG